MMPSLSFEVVVGLSRCLVIRTLYQKKLKEYLVEIPPIGMDEIIKLLYKLNQFIVREFL